MPYALRFYLYLLVAGVVAFMAWASWLISLLRSLRVISESLSEGWCLGVSSRSPAWVRVASIAAEY